MTPQRFLTALAEQLLVELTPNAKLREFTRNSDLVGQYAEACVRRLIAQIVSPLRVSRGAVISEHLCSDSGKVPQLDAIIWAPSPAPAIFAAGDFGLIPRSSCFGFLEIKSSLYSGCGVAMKKIFDRAEELVSEQTWLMHNATGGTVLGAHDPQFACFGVVCLRTKGCKRDRQFEALRDRRQAVVLLQENDDGVVAPDPEGVLRLVNFLIQRHQVSKPMIGSDFVNLALYKPTTRSMARRSS